MGDKSNLDGARKAAWVILSVVRPDGGQRAYKYQAAMVVHDSRFDPEAVQATAKTIEAAKAGDRDARAALHAAIGWMVRERVDLPDPLREYLLDLLAAEDGPSKRGQPPHRHYLRNGLIAHAVQVVVKEYGFDRTRNPATETPSACSIVAEVLAEFGVTMTEKNVEKITEPLS